MASGSLILYRGKRGDVWRIKYADASGRQVMETVGPAKCDKRDGLSRKEAKQALTNRLSDVDRKRYRKPKPLTFRAFQAQWFDGQGRLRQWQQTTTDVYENVLRRLTANFGPMQLAAIRPTHVADYVDEQSKRLGASTVNRDVGILYDIMATAVKAELVDSNPVAGADRPRIADTDWRILTPAEVRRVAKAFKDPQARVLFLTLVSTGLRKSELQALRWRDVSLTGRVLRVVKSKSKAGRRVIAIPPMLAEELVQHYSRTRFKGEDERVFAHGLRGTIVRPEQWRPQFEAALAEAGIADYVRPFHDLRHTAITNWAASGLPPVVIMTQAGHSSMNTTQGYIDLAGVVFADEAAQAERRMLGSPLSTESSTDLSTPEGSSAYVDPREEAATPSA